MFKTPFPINETERLECLTNLKLDHTVPILGLNGLCQIAAHIAGAEIALISMVGKDDQEFVASVGLDKADMSDVTCTSRGVSFCSHAIMRSDQFIVEDALLDTRFANNPLVTDGLKIRSYAGTPLEPEQGLFVGALCVIDRHPRSFDEAVLEKLRDIARAVTELLKAHRDRLRLSDALRESERQRAAVERASRIDSLTGLLSAETFWRGLSQATSEPQPVALVLMDVDRLKVVNDAYGRQFGDIYLKSIAEALTSSIPVDGQVGRLGSDQFGFTLRGVNATEANVERILELCRSEVKERALKFKRPELGHLSCGVALRADSGESCDALFQQADIALSAAKNNGRNCATVYDKCFESQFTERVLRTEFSAALNAGEIVPYYQPKWCLQTGAIIGSEVLCRWNHPKRGLLTPFAFHNMLNDPQTGPMLTREMLKQACRDYLALRDLELDPGRFAFNVTQFDLANPGFADMLDHILDDYNIPWNQIIIEVTEGVVLGQEDGQIRKAMTHLRNRGVKVALDDFGTGYGGLQHLATWPIDEIKIDRSFTSVIDTDSRTRAIAQSIIILCNSLGLSVVAEGIETENQATILREMNCDIGQGFLRGRPMSLDSLKGFLKKENHFEV
ncbi:putative bifunctional diguanylate cyclase/phosphodiesterase [Loktanella sp. DJP18]|uniref:putative bifunctional diguanylate cyclase/phosphodiesterase n=1 Tax=Loktanella sp. DJP18 TaxID=3409788 RepID=UPI003BB5D2E2